MLRQQGLEWLNREWISAAKTPCFIYHLESIIGRIHRIRRAFASTAYSQYYPVKTNPNLDLVRCCTQNGLGLDACSMGDLEIADMLKVNRENISFTSAVLSDQDMRYLHRKRIIPNLNSAGEIKRWGSLFPGTRVGVRVSTFNSGGESHGGYALKMGVFAHDWPEIQRVVLQHQLQIVKLHRHESQNSISHQELLDAFAVTFSGVPAWVWKNVRSINYGGGWGLPYLRQGQLDVEKLVKGIVNITQKLKTTTALETLKIEIEPGEFLVGESGYILSTVMEVRNVHDHPMGKNLQIITLDTPFPITSGARKAELLSMVKFDLNEQRNKAESVFTLIYGRSNTSMDTINRGISAPVVRVGDHALIFWVGAYVPILLSHFNEQDIPAEFIFQNNEWKKSRDSVKFQFHYKHAYLKRRKK